MAGQAVAYLDIYSAASNSYDTNSSIEVCGNDQFHLGRDPELCRHSWSTDLTISRRHVRVHCILYEQDPVSDIAPFVYATDLSVNGTCIRKLDSDSASSSPMLRHCAVLLDHGDELHLSATIRLRFRSTRFFEPTQLNPYQEMEISTFSHQYAITERLLGEGACGKVLVGRNQTTQQQLACKLIKLDHLYNRASLPNLRLPTGERGSKGKGNSKRWPTRVAACFREFDILKDLAHPNIIAIEKVFWSDKTIYIFQELVTGGDLFSFLEYKGGRLENAQAAVVIRQVLIGVKYLHEQGVVHRDLKPDNILMTSLEDGARLVINDFGGARFLPEHTPSNQDAATRYQRMFSYVGTLEYTAPEIHKANPTIAKDQGYTSSVDMWSVGSITATVLTGDVIFTNRRHPAYEQNPSMVIMHLAGQCDLRALDELDHPTWMEVAFSAKDFIKRLLVLEENDRMTAAQALEHAWFANQFYVKDLEDVYNRAVAGWRPRQAGTELVERISRRMPNFLSAPPSGQGEVSSFFKTTRQSSVDETADTVSSSQSERKNTPLPSNTNDDNFHHFASPPTGSMCSPDYQESADSQCHTVCDYDNPAGNSCDAAQKHSASAQATYNTFEGTYHAEYSPDQQGSYETTASLNDVGRMSYSQYPLHECSQQSARETLPDDQDETDYGSCDSYQPTQYSEEHARISAADEEDVSVVRETPPQYAYGNDDA